MLAGSRFSAVAISPSRATAPINCSIEPSGKRGLLPIGYQVSPYRAVRRNAGPLSPPIHIGGYGFCRGLGRKLMFLNWTNSPSNTGSSSVHSILNACRYSSVTRPRWSNGGAPSASNSSRIQPAPTPSVIRPCESTSIVATSLAVSTAPRCGITVIDVTNRGFSVSAARKDNTLNWSKQNPDAEPGNSPDAL